MGWSLKGFRWAKVQFGKKNWRRVELLCMKVWRELRKGRKVEEKQQQNLEMPKRWVRGEHQRCSQSQEGGWGCGIHETLMFVRVSGLFWVSLSFFSNVQ